MIRLERLTKRFPGQGTPAVEDLTLSIPAGEIVILVGPSGCGKTTTMRMINRLVEPTSGRIFLEGEDVTTVNADRLRRRIGYVIQQVGLFPHLTIFENIATVPRLLRWPAPRIRARVDELLELVGMDPSQYRDRGCVPKAGQRLHHPLQRVRDPVQVLQRRVCEVIRPTYRTLMARVRRDDSLLTLIGHTGLVNPVAFGAGDDGRLLLASAGQDSPVRLWDPATGAPVGDPLHGHTDSVTAVAFGAGGDGQPLLASAGQDSTVRLWDPVTRSAIVTLLRRTSARAVAT